MTCAEIRDLIVSLTDSLAWPAFAVFALLILRPLLWRLSSLIETIRYKDLELNFGQTVQDVAERAESLPGVEEPVVDDALSGILDPDPRITILKSWASVETAIENLARAHRQELGRVNRMSTRRRIDMLRSANLIDPDLTGVLHEMGSVRNLIAHGRDIPLAEDAVHNFARSAARVASIVEQQLGASRSTD